MTTRQITKREITKEALRPASPGRVPACDEGEELRRLNRTLRALTECSQAMLRSTDEATFLKEVCRIVVQDCGHAMVWIGFAEDDPGKSIRPVAHSGFEEGYLDTIQATWADTERGRGPTGTAIRTGRPSVCTNVLTDPSFAPWREEALKRGYASDIALPLMADGRAFGAITIYSRDPDPFSEDEQKLLSELANDLAYGVTAMRSRADRKRAVAALRESEERLRLVVEHAPAGVAMFDREMRFLVVSRRYASDRRLEGQELLGRSHYEVFPEIPDRWREVHQRCLAGAVERCDEDRFPHPDGTVDWVRWEIHPWRRSDDEIGGIILFSEVITEKRRLEEQFRQAQKLESIGRLAGGIAHDFNNLLAVILSCAEALQGDVTAGAPAQPELVDEIHEAGKRAAALTRQLLAFARKQVIAPIALDLNAVVHESEKLLRRVLGERVVLVTSLQPALWTVRCDPGQMEQVILNLAINARDAMPRGGELTIESTNVEVDDALIAVHPFMRAGQHVRLAIGDSGTGMTSEVKRHAFEPFFTTKPAGSGTGLGLATVYGIVKQNGGYILLESEAGRGTTFELYFPRTYEAAASPPTVATTSGHGTETVLVVEDDPLVREVTLRSLRAGGYRVIVAGSGGEALDAAAREAGPLHLLVTDVVMPGLSGPEVAEELRRRRPELRVLYVSGYASDVISQAGIADAGVELLEKPFTTASLLSRVRAVLDGD